MNAKASVNLKQLSGVKLQSMTEAYAEKYFKTASEAVEHALVDTSEGAQDRSEQNAY